MKINVEALKALELKLAEYTKENGAIAEHESANSNACQTGCFSSYSGRCSGDCSGSCKHSKNLDLSKSVSLGI